MGTKGGVGNEIGQKEKSNGHASPTKSGPTPWEGLEHPCGGLIELASGCPK